MAGGATWLLTRPAPGTEPGGKVNIAYEVYERDAEGGWKKSTVTMDELLGGKPLP